MSATTGLPVVGAMVTIAEESTRTDESGVFTLSGVPGDECTGTVAIAGFPAYDFTASTAQANQPVNLEIPDCLVRLEIVERAVEPTTV